jgi:hypothetical protein
MLTLHCVLDCFETLVEGGGARAGIKEARSANLADPLKGRKMRRP